MVDFKVALRGTLRDETPGEGVIASEEQVAQGARGALVDARLLQNFVPIYGTALALASLAIPDGLTVIRTNGYRAADDGGSATYRLRSAGEADELGDQVSNGGAKRWALAIADWYTPQQFGAYGNANFVRNGSGVTTGFTGNDDFEAVQNCLYFAARRNAGTLLTGRYRIHSGELVVSGRAQVVAGLGSGIGYGSIALSKYDMLTGLIVTGASPRAVRTRVRWRGSASDPQDDPLSVVVNVQNEGVTLRDFSVFLFCDFSDTSITNLGADRDIGIFNGCRTFLTMSNIQVLGYFREANVWLDVTRLTELPQFSDPNTGQPFPNGSIMNGADHMTLSECFFYGSEFRIQGAKPEPGKVGFDLPYYDEILGGTRTDRRGSFGCSDFVASACAFYGRQHHSGRRLQAATGNYLTDPAKGCLRIDGLTGVDGREIQGMLFDAKCRFAGWDPFRIRLERCRRVTFMTAHSEYNGAPLNPDGSPVALNDSDTYGPFSTTELSTAVTFVNLNASLRPVFIARMAELDNLMAASANTNHFARGIETEETLIVRGQTTLGARVDFGGQLFATGAVDIRSGTGQTLQFRYGSSGRLEILDLYVEAKRPLRITGNTLANLPPANTATNLVTIVSNTTRGVRPVYSDGTVWRYFEDSAAI